VLLARRKGVVGRTAVVVVAAERGTAGKTAQRPWR
jgi:hypothetical protein